MFARPPATFATRHSPAAAAKAAAATTGMAGKPWVHACFARAAPFKAMVSVLSPLLSELPLDFVAGSAPQMRVERMSSTPVAFVALVAEAPFFARLAVRRSCQVAVSMPTLVKICKHIGADDLLELLYYGDERVDPRLELRVTRGSAATSFALRTMRISGDALAIPAMAFAAQATMSAAAFRGAVDAFGDLSDSVWLSVYPGGLYVHGSGDAGEVRTLVPAGEDDGGEAEGPVAVLRRCDEGAAVQLPVMLTYLMHFAAAAALSPHVQISVAPDVPLRVRFPLRGAAGETGAGGHVDFYMAPRELGDEQPPPLPLPPAKRARRATEAEGAREGNAGEGAGEGEAVAGEGVKAAEGAEGEAEVEGAKEEGGVVDWLFGE